jgi:hypothetical protein
MAKKTKSTKSASKPTRRKPAPAVVEATAEPDWDALEREHRESAARTAPRITENDLAILEAARIDTHSSLAELRDALIGVICWSNALELSFAQRQTLPRSVLLGAWSEQWKKEYQQWLQSIRKALDAAGRPAVAAIMDPNSHPQPAPRWTAMVRDQLNRLLRSLHPMNEGVDGLGFIRSGATSLPTAFPWPRANLRRMVGELEAVAPTVTPTAKSADGANLAVHERDDKDWKPADHFPVKMRSRLRQATRDDRKSKRVRKKVVDGTVLYSFSDARRWWGAELE